jgi:hypothetical protein
MQILANGIEFAEQDDGFREVLNPSYGDMQAAFLDCVASLAMAM